MSTLSINPSFSPSFCASCSSDTPSASSSSNSQPPFKVSSFCPPRPQPLGLACTQSQFLLSKRPKSWGLTQSSAKDMTITDFKDDEESPPLMVESEVISRPRRIALFVEPSPFAYVSGYKNRFQNFIRYLREMGDEVMVVTTHEGVPQEFYGAKLIGSRSFPCPWYQKVPLSLALSPRIIYAVAQFKPDIIHASSPGIMVFGALIIAKLLSVPLVMSYHTHVPVYIPRYTFSWLVKPMWWVIKFLHRAADLTLVPSAALAKELEAARVTAGNKVHLWNKGVDSESFHPKYRAQEMRIRLSNGEPERPLIVHVGRLGVEKSLDLLKSVMDQIPEARIAFIGDGPYREDLEKLFSGMLAVFTGMLGGVASLLAKRSMSFSAIEVCDHETNGVENDLSDDGSQAGEKKRRLNLEQVKTLEKNFELGNKLESERKMQLARALRLQPRQIAIWFQNMRARWKTKQLEKGYDVLKRQFDAIKADNDALQSQNQKLQAEIIALKNREPTESINLNKETEGSSSNRSEKSSEIKLDISTRTPPAMDSPSSNHHHGHPIIPTSSSRPLFPPSIITRPTSAAVAHLFPNSSSSSRQPDHKIIDHQNAVKEESFSNMFCAIDDQSGFWPWLEQQHFN